MKQNLIFVGISCNECLEGMMKALPEIITKDGSVIFTQKCDKCGYTESIKNEPFRSIRETGVKKCDNCGYDLSSTHDAA